ncbi:MAG TPA: cytochrome c3 family protein [Candidatus Binatia bacterium]
MNARALAAVLLLVALPRLGVADDNAAPPEEFKMTTALQEMLDSHDDKDAVVLDQAQRKVFDALPAHARQLFADAVDNEYIGSATQIREILSLDLDTTKLELVLTNNCLLCHSNDKYQDPPTLFSLDPVAAGSPPYMNLRNFVSDAHFRHNLACAGCHGGDPTGNMAHDHPDQWPTDRDERIANPKWIPEFCGRCHSDPKYMGTFNPSLPTDQLAKYKTSHHGKALLEGGNPRAAQCVSCHGVHGIQPAKSPASSVFSKNVPETCGKCHSDPKVMEGVKLPDGSPIPTDQLAKYKTSVHGRALLEKGDTGAPACNDCHGNHAAAPAEVSSVAQICRTCHARNGTLFEGSPHKAAFEKHGWPECQRCHGSHAIDKPTDAMLTTTKGSLCADCHDQNAKDKPECKQTAAHFHDTIVGMVDASTRFGVLSAELAEKGLDVDPLDDERRSLDDALKQSRSEIHSFDRSDFDEVAGKGLETVTKMQTLVKGVDDEYRDRRSGLLVAIASLVVVVLALWMKIRSIERGK